MSEKTLAELQDEIEEEYALPPCEEDDGQPVEDITKREPEIIKRGRGFPKGQSRPGQQKPHVQIRMRLAQDCYEYIQFLVANGNAENLTEAIETCIRESRQAQRIN